MQDDLNREKKYITKQKKKKKQNKKANKQKQYDWKNVNRDKFFYHFKYLLPFVIKGQACKTCPKSN